jgi:signal transduction histidine kinase
VLNARDAFVASGRTGTIEIQARRTPEGAVLSVSDDGPGISPEVRAQLGHEYFTTKPHGTGLGLSVARKLAQVVHGRLEIPVTERGARIELHLPCA